MTTNSERFTQDFWQADLIGNPRPPTPILDARREGLQLIIWCQHCHVEHRHGACRNGPECGFPRFEQDWTLFDLSDRTCICPPGSTDRLTRAHCTNPESPYLITGYFLRETTQ